jgi:hypothetical protein
VRKRNCAERHYAGKRQWENCGEFCILDLKLGNWEARAALYQVFPDKLVFFIRVVHNTRLGIGERYFETQL